MTQVATLRTGKWANQIATNDEVVEKVKEIKDIIRKNSWGTKYIFVYGRRENILEFIDSTNWDKYEKMTFMSKQVILSQLNGLIRIYINRW